MHTHAATGADIPSRGRGASHKARAAAFLLQLVSCGPYSPGYPGGTAASLSLSPVKGSTSSPPPSSPRLWAGFGRYGSPGQVRCAPPRLQPVNPGEDLLFLLKPSVGVITLKLGLSHFGLLQVFMEQGCRTPVPLQHGQSQTAMTGSSPQALSTLKIAKIDQRLAVFSIFVIVIR